MKRKVYLDGELGEKFGKELTLDVDSFADVFRLLECNNPEVRKYLEKCHKDNIGFMLQVEDTPLTTDQELLMKFSKGDMYISPVPAGSGGGIGKIFAAVVLVVVGLTLGITGLAAYIVYGTAASLALAGIAELMAPDPATDDTSTDSSYLFQGSGQTILEGDPVPLLYGRLRIPGRLIDFDVRNTNSYYAESGFGIAGAGLGAEASAGGPGGPSEINAPDSIIPLNASQYSMPGQVIAVNIDTVISDINKPKIISPVDNTI